MSEKLVDARNLACPEPVMLTRKAMLEAEVDRVRVLVTSDVPAENIQRLARSQGWTPVVERQGAEIVLTLTRESPVAGQSEQQTQPQPAATVAEPRIVVLISSHLLGSGEERLGQILMRAFVKTLREVEPRPARIIFVNSGIFLTTEGSELIDDLQLSEPRGDRNHVVRNVPRLLPQVGGAPRRRCLEHVRYRHGPFTGRPSRPTVTKRCKTSNFGFSSSTRSTMSSPPKTFFGRRACGATWCPFRGS